jgi:chitodextrinase
MKSAVVKKSFSVSIIIALLLIAYPFSSALAAPLGSGVSAKGVAVAPAAPALSAPANNAIVRATPTFSWLASAGANAYQFQYATNTAFTTGKYTSAILSTRTHKPPTMPQKIYYWHVRARNASGQWSVWSSVRKITIDTTPPAKPALSSPANNAIVHATPTFSWLASAGANAYQFQYATNTGFTAGVYTSAVLTTLNHKPPVMAQRIYYWHVKARDAAGNWSVWSSYRKLTIDTPAAPVLSSPANNASVSSTPTFKWLASIGANLYQFQYATNPGFTAGVYTASLSTLSLKPPTMSPGIYYWRVKARNASNLWSVWSSVRKLTMSSPPPAAPVLHFPLNNDVYSTPTPTFSWYASPGADDYHFQYATDTGFTAGVVNYPGVIDLEFAPNDMADNVYYWRVRTRDGSLWSVWSPYRTLTIDTIAPAAPELVSPADDYHQLYMPGGNPTFYWDASAGANRYMFEYARDSGFTTGNDSGWLTVTSYKPPTDMAQYFEYWWRVKATDAAGNISGWSSVRKLHIY